MKITRQSRRILQGAIFSLLFVFMQTATLLHAEVHEFHTPTDLCKIFQSNQNHTGGVIQVNTLVQAIFLPVATTVTRLELHTPYSYTHFAWSRAPPSVS